MNFPVLTTSSNKESKIAKEILFIDDYSPFSLISVEIRTEILQRAKMTFIGEKTLGKDIPIELTPH